MANVSNFQYIIASQPYSVYVNEATPLRQYIVANVFIDGTASSTTPTTVVSGLVTALAPSFRQNVKVIGY